MLSLALLWPRPGPPGGGLRVAVSDASVPAVDTEPTPSDAFANPGLWSARHSLLQSEPEHEPSSAISFIQSEPPLRVIGPRPPSLLN
jgi:hypothetical protein